MAERPVAVGWKGELSLGCFYAFANNSGQMDVEHLVDLLAVIAKAAQSLNR